MSSRINGTREERFWPKVQKTQTCWLWTGFKNRQGYGAFGARPQPLRAHRVSYELAYGPIPAGLFVLHTCDNPPCVRPSHLFLGTARDNCDDMMRKGRGQSRLTAAQVREIRARYIPWKFGTLKLAREYGVTRSLIGAIVLGKKWHHLLGEQP